jgi:hypothetical protein
MGAGFEDGRAGHFISLIERRELGSMDWSGRSNRGGRVSRQYTSGKDPFVSTDEMVAPGKSFIKAKACKPIRKVVPIDEPQPAPENRRLGFMKDAFETPDDFDTMMADEIDEIPSECGFSPLECASQGIPQTGRRREQLSRVLRCQHLAFKVRRLNFEISGRLLRRFLLGTAWRRFSPPGSMLLRAKSCGHARRWAMPSTAR